MGHFENKFDLHSELRESAEHSLGRDAVSPIVTRLSAYSAACLRYIL